MLWLFLLIPVRAASICDAEPLVLTIQDVQVLPDVQDSYMKGIAAQIGSPVQDIVLLPWA